MNVDNGNIKLISSGAFEGFTTEKIAKNFINNDEVIAFPSGGTASIKY
jgi:hypothetical protein